MSGCPTLGLPNPVIDIIYLTIAPVSMVIEQRFCILNRTAERKENIVINDATLNHKSMLFQLICNLLSRQCNSVEIVVLLTRCYSSNSDTIQSAFGGNNNLN